FSVGGAGRLRDRDFDDDGTLSSETQHPANTDNVFYVSVDVGYRLWSSGPARDGVRWAIDGLLGYQHWREKYVAHGGVDVLPGGRPLPSSSSVLSNDFTWDSFRLGARTQLAGERWDWQTRVLFIPATNFRDSDVHFLRDDLRQDPSFVDRATGGFGVL